MKRFWQTTNIVTLVFALIANYIVSAMIIDVPPINQVSDTYATLLTPATYAFSIWSVIYLWLIIFVMYQARDLFSAKAGNTLPQQVGPFFAVASILNGLWTYLFVNDFIGVSVIVLLTLTISLYALLHRLYGLEHALTGRYRVLVWWPLCLYAGWVTVASVVNIASWFDSIGFMINSLTAVFVMVALGIFLVTLGLLRPIGALLLSSAWGIAAIGVRQSQLDGDSYVTATAYCVTVLLLGTIMVNKLKKQK